MNQKTRRNRQRRNTIRHRNNKRRQRKTRTRRVGGTGTLPSRPSKNPPKGYLRLPGNSPPSFVYPLNHGNASTLNPVSVPPPKPPRKKSLNLNSVFAPPTEQQNNTNMIQHHSKEELERIRLKQLQRIRDQLNKIELEVLGKSFTMFNGSAKEDATDPMQSFNPTISENHFKGLDYTHYKPVNYSHPELR